MNFIMLKIEYEINNQLSNEYGYANLFDIYSTRYTVQLKNKSLKTDEDVDRFIDKLCINTKNKNGKVVRYKNKLTFIDSSGSINPELEPLIYNNYIVFFLRCDFIEVTLEAAFKIDKNLNSDIKRLLINREV